MVSLVSTSKQKQGDIYCKYLSLRSKSWQKAVGGLVKAEISAVPAKVAGAAGARVQEVAVGKATDLLEDGQARRGSHQVGAEGMRRRQSKVLNSHECTVDTK